MEMRIVLECTKRAGRASFKCIIKYPGSKEKQWIRFLTYCLSSRESASFIIPTSAIYGVPMSLSPCRGIS